MLDHIRDNDVIVVCKLDRLARSSGICWKHSARPPHLHCGLQSHFFAREVSPHIWRLTRTRQAMAAHETPRTTELYDRTDDQITMDEVEKIGI
jgi:hypothetical protein